MTGKFSTLCLVEIINEKVGLSSKAIWTLKDSRDREFIRSYCKEIFGVPYNMHDYKIERYELTNIEPEIRVKFYENHGWTFDILLGMTDVDGCFESLKCQCDEIFFENIDEAFIAAKHGLDNVLRNLYHNQSIN